MFFQAAATKLIEMYCSKLGNIRKYHIFVKGIDRIDRDAESPLIVRY